MREGEDRTRLLARRLTRRRVLRAALVGGAGLAGVAIVGCGGKEEAPQPTPTGGQTLAPTQSPGVELLTPVPGLARAGWVQLKPSGELPSARVHHSLVWDDVEGQVYLFGGRSAGTPLNDLWAFNVEAPAWTQVQPEGPLPPARFGHNAVFDPGEGQLVVFGGQAGDTFFNDLWTFSPRDNVWAEVTPSGVLPAARVGAAAALDTEARRLYVTHGLGAEGYLDDTWVLDLASAAWEEVSSPAGRPSKRGFLRAVWYPPGGRLVTFGGESPEVPRLADVWSFDPVSRVWEELPPGERSPKPRSQYGAVYVPDREWMLTFGGAGEGVNFSDLWFYIPPDVGWGYISTLGVDPGSRSGLDLAFVPHRLSVILFGGYRMGEEKQETWELGVGEPEG